MTETLEFEFR